MLNINTIVVAEKGRATRLVLTDNTNYASMGITANTVKGIFTIRKDNAIIYQNENYVGSPDIDIAVGNTKTVITNTEIASYNGNWEITYTIVHAGGTQSSTFSYTATNFATYNISQEYTVDCANAILRSEDTTNYDNLNLVRIAENYTHTLTSKTSGNLVATTAVATQKFPSLYNEVYTTSIVAQNRYSYHANFSIRYIAKFKATYEVACKIDTCDVVCCLECLRQKMFDAEFVNPTLFEELQEKFVYSTSLLQLYQAALNCGQIHSANELAKQIHDLTGCSDGCNTCKCSGNQVRPELLPCSGSSVPCPPSNYYGNTAISEQVQKQCPPPQIGTYVTATFAANQIFANTQSAAQALAQRLFDAEKQSIANTQGTCTNTCTALGGTVTPTEPCCVGLVLQGTTCQNACNAGFVAVNGVCVIDCAGIGQAPSPISPCCAGLVNQNGLCQSACSSGFTPVNGVCQPICGQLNQTPHPTYGCCNGLFIENGLCVSQCSVGFSANAQGVCTPLCSSVGQAPHPTYGCCAGLVVQDGVCQTECNINFLPNVNGVCEQICATNGQSNTLPCCNGLSPIRLEAAFLPNYPINSGEGVCVACLPQDYISRPREYPTAGANTSYYDMPCCIGLHRYRNDWNSTVSVTTCKPNCSTVAVVISGNTFTYNSEPTSDVNGSICVPCAGNGQVPITWNGQPKCCTGLSYNSLTNTCLPA